MKIKNCNSWIEIYDILSDKKIASYKTFAFANYLWVTQKYELQL